MAGLDVLGPPLPSVTRGASSSPVVARTRPRGWAGLGLRWTPARRGEPSRAGVLGQRGAGAALGAG